MSDNQWRQPRKWNREAEANGKPKFVFSASMSDVFQDHPELVEHRERLWELIEETPWLTWLLLTKRPENIKAMLPWAEAPHNVWTGTSVENARHSYRARQLVEVPAPVHFLSCEPMLGSLFESRGNRVPLDLDDVEWIITGGESGPKFRPMDLDHARELRDACLSASVPFFLKQIGGRTPKAGGKTLDGRQWAERPQPISPLAAAVLF